MNKLSEHIIEEEYRRAAELDNIINERERNYVEENFDDDFLTDDDRARLHALDEEEENAGENSYLVYVKELGCEIDFFESLYIRRYNIRRAAFARNRQIPNPEEFLDDEE